jgi:hypothetical protein
MAAGDRVESAAADVAQSGELGDTGFGADSAGGGIGIECWDKPGEFWRERWSECGGGDSESEWEYFWGIGSDVEQQ